MPDLWILAFMARGVIGAAGDVMPLEQCVQRGQDMSQNTHITCINVQDPSCRVYFEDSPATNEITARCLKRVTKETQKENGNVQ